MSPNQGFVLSQPPGARLIGILKEIALRLSLKKSVLAAAAPGQAANWVYPWDGRDWDELSSEWKSSAATWSPLGQPCCVTALLCDSPSLQRLWWLLGKKLHRQLEVLDSGNFA